MKTLNTTVHRLLDLVFEGHHIRSLIENGELLVHAKDIALAVGISKYKDAIANHLDRDEVHLRSISTGPQVRSVMFLTQTGVMALVMCSRKPAARRVRRWITGTVIPEIMRTGTFVDGSTPAEKLQALCRRARQERAELMGLQTEEAAASGLATLRAMRLELGMDARDALAYAGETQRQGKLRGVKPEKRYIAGHPCNPVNVWPRPILLAAASNITPKLPFYEETEVQP